MGIETETFPGVKREVNETTGCEEGYFSCANGGCCPYNTKCYGTRLCKLLYCTAEDVVCDENWCCSPNQYCVLENNGDYGCMNTTTSTDDSTNTGVSPGSTTGGSPGATTTGGTTNNFAFASSNPAKWKRGISFLEEKSRDFITCHEYGHYLCSSGLGCCPIGEYCGSDGYCSTIFKRAKGGKKNDNDS
ncbi:443_t:CDS:2 [Diversispora eburnea]|uniref:443_t:CDS:1 n=1 Tax=Diversispora eburnea TaxID=1213867 RepID=A0A9N9AX48_9GLOM|nr:443_t:CDS:2 [Diversispora eburnea]